MGSTSSSAPDDGRLVHPRRSAGLRTLERTLQQQTSVEDVLAWAATIADRSIADADGVSAALINRGRVDVRGASNGFADAVDTLQYAIGDGPCLTAAAEGRTVQADSLGQDESRWAPLGAGTHKLVLRSVLAVPLRVDDIFIGSLNVYAHADHAFGEVTANIAALVAELLAAVPGSFPPAPQLAPPTTVRSELEEENYVDAAVGILMFRGDLVEMEALDHLRQIATGKRQSVETAASVIVRDARRWAVKTTAKHSW